MKAYRTYMDRVKLPGQAHARLMEALEGGPRKASPLRRYAALAACCALALLAGWGIARGGPATSLDGPPGTVDTYGPGAALPPAPTPSAPAATAAPEGPHTLVVGDPLEGQPHGDFNLPDFAFDDLTGAPRGAARIVPPEGYFQEAMTAGEIVRALGETDQVPWDLYWAGFGLDGTVIYDGQGQVWQAVITGEKGDAGFTLRLSPGQLPLEDAFCEGAREEDYNGVAVTGYFARYDRDGDGREEYVYSASFLAGDTGVRFECVSPHRETAEELTLHLIRRGAVPSGGFTTGHLVPAEIPEWRSEGLTLEEARAEDLGAWLPAAPEGFSFEGARRELGQDRDYLSVSWTRGYDYVEVTVWRAGVSPYGEAPDFRLEEITAQALEDWGSYVEQDAGDTPGWRFLGLRVDCGDAEAVYSIKGLTPRQAAELIAG